MRTRKTNPQIFLFHLLPRRCPSTAGDSPLSMPSVVFCLLLSPFQMVPSFLVMSSCHLLLGRPLDLFSLLGCHSVQHLVHLLILLYMSSPFPLFFQCAFCNDNVNMHHTITQFLFSSLPSIQQSQKGLLSCALVAISDGQVQSSSSAFPSYISGVLQFG